MVRGKKKKSDVIEKARASPNLQVVGAEECDLNTRKKSSQERRAAVTWN